MGIYFHKLLRTLVDVGELNRRRVLDFGCGRQMLKSYLTHANYIGYDIDPQYSDVTSPPSNTVFDVMVANEVFYEMCEDDIVEALDDIKPRLLLVGIGRKGWLNKLGSMIFDRTAHDHYKTLPEQELEILQRGYRIIKRKGVWGLADVYLMERIDV